MVEGTDVTLAAYGPLVVTARDAALAALDDGLSVEVVDLRSLSPLDLDTLEASVRKTGRLVVTHEAQRNGGLGAEIVASITDRCFDVLKAGARAGDRVRHPVPRGEGRGPLPARPRPAPRCGRPRDGQSALPDRVEGVMIQTITLPDLGEGLTESDLVEWTVAVGDTVELNQVVAEVETAKALVQLPSPYAGVVAELLVEAGRHRPGRGAAADDHGRRAAPWRRADVEPRRGRRGADEPPDAAPARTSVLVGYGPLAETSARPRRRSRSAEWVAAHAIADDVAAVALAARRVGPKVLPPVRKLAHDLGVDLNRMEGTGKDGMITREDVLHVVSGAGSAPAVDPVAERGRPAGGSTAATPSTGTPRRPAAPVAAAPSGARGPDPRRGRPQADRRGDGGERVHRPARVDVADGRRHADARAARAVPGRPRAGRAPDLDPDARRQGRDDRARPQPVAQRALGRGRGRDRRSTGT